MPHSSILVSGATGLLGNATIRHLAAKHGVEQIAALVRRGRKTAELDALGIQTIEVDLCAAGLGLPADQYEALAASTRAIVHCAADIRFNIPLEASRQVNVVGTANLLHFARRCRKLDKFAHMSTVYVSGGRSGYILEEEAEPGTFFSSYQQTKFEAERLVLDAMKAIPASIYRFSTMIYNRKLRRVAQFNYFHQLLRLASVNPLRMIPAQRHARIDLIPSDWAALAFDRLFEERWRAGEIIHICAGPEHSLTVDDLFKLTFDSFRAPGGRPDIVTLDEFNSKAESILTTPSRKQMWQSLSSFLPHMNVDQTFERSKVSDLARGVRELDLPDTRRMFVDMLSYCVASDWGMRQSEATEIN